MAKKKLDDIKLMFDPIDKKICIGQVDEDLGDGLMFATNKKDITQDFLNMAMRYYSEICGKHTMEWESGVGTIRFTPKENKLNE